MKMILSWTLALSVALGMSAGRASGADGRTLEAWTKFKELDTNVNGELSLKEFKRHLAGETAEKAELLFERLDKDLNGALKFDEYKRGHKRG